MIKIKFKDMPDFSIDFPLTARDILSAVELKSKEKVVACRVNNVQRPLSWTVDMDSSLEFITTNSIEGAEIYLRTLMFMLTSAAFRTCGLKLHLRQSMNYSYYYISKDKPIGKNEHSLITAEMNRMIKTGVALPREVVPIDKAKAIMSRQGYCDKENLLRWVNDDPVVLYKCEGIYDFFSGVIADTASAVPAFGLHMINGGLALSVPTFASPTKASEFKTSEKTLELFENYARWLDHLSINTMDKIHHLVASGHSRDLIMVSEALHTKTMSKIAEDIEKRKDVRLLCLAGPSSSGKTTSSRRLRVQLLSSGINSVTLELDNYFVDRDRTPKDPDGSYNFEALEALDTDLINEHIEALIAGKEVDIPSFDFVSGRRTSSKKLKLEKNQLLVIEGIHGLNDKLTESIPHDTKYRLFICPLTGAAVDTHIRVGTTDTRLLRRIVRDNRKRGNSPESTLMQWPSVVRGAHMHIFPYQEKADALFNTSLAYELPVLKGYVLPLLMSVEENSPVYGEAQRLLSILKYVPVIPSDDVPNLSIIREFIGGSCFE